MFIEGLRITANVIRAINQSQEPAVEFVLDHRILCASRHGDDIISQFAECSSDAKNPSGCIHTVLDKSLLHNESG